METTELRYNWNSIISEGFHKAWNTSEVFQIIDTSQEHSRNTKTTQKSDNNSYINLNNQLTVIYILDNASEMALQEVEEILKISSKLKETIYKMDSRDTLLYCCSKFHCSYNALE